ncbi:hypothetical protein E4K10_44535 [Streptomyces sp. T1317-0309]|nr:hypothetical protein E4K10_44535 [Streptomyces sp. T1317-0309]
MCWTASPDGSSGVSRCTCPRPPPWLRRTAPSRPPACRRRRSWTRLSGAGPRHTPGTGRKPKCRAASRRGAGRGAAKLGVAARRLRLQEQQLNDCRRVQVLNGAYLVDESQTARFTKAVATLRRRAGALIELSGPWVPYSFAGEDGAHGDH